MPMVGRYAPSPTGALHLGNLRTALVAWLQSRLQGGEFLLRMEDLDQPRVVSGSADQILKDLQWLGIDWDGPVLYQSSRQNAYEQALQQLHEQNLIYPCYCSRKELREAASAPHGATAVYPGTCESLSQLERDKSATKKTPSYRLRVSSETIHFVDGILGKQQQHLQTDVGDFVVKRADQLFAYQFAVVLDDLAQNITHVVRGADLTDSTARQLYLAQFIQPRSQAIEYWHVPLKTDSLGQRLAKRDGSESAQAWQAHSSSQQLVGQFALELGLIDKSADLSVQELLGDLTTVKLQQALQLKSRDG